MKPTVAIAILLLAQAASAAQGADARPNIVLVLADDLGWGDVGFNGRKEWQTPHLDRLAARGTVFSRFYAAAVVCAPSRAALLTGKATIHDRVSRNDDDLPAEETTIAEALKAQGYATGLFGKWHHGKPRTGQSPPSAGEGEESTAYVHPMDQGFDEFFGFTDAVHAWEKFPKTLWNGRKRVDVSGYADDLFTERAIDFLRRHRQGPFFLYVPYIATHFNIEAPPDEIALYRGKLPEADPENPVNATYAAMVSRLDRHVGQLMATLDELGLSENTLLVFTSDHGATFERGNQGASSALDSNRPFRGQKRTLWEGGIRVPAIACWPGHVANGVTSAAIVHMTDLFPTFLAAAGGKPETAWHVDGINQLPVWLGKAEPVKRPLFWEWRSEGASQLAALDDNWKLVVSNGGKPELFDLLTDPAERRDVAATHPELVKRMHQQLRDWLATEIRP